MIVQALMLGMVKIGTPVLLARAVWWMVADLVMARMNLPFV
jgi:hypothetical protein